jgi:hypothetical protein
MPDDEVHTFVNGLEATVGTETSRMGLELLDSSSLAANTCATRWGPDWRLERTTGRQN